MPVVATQKEELTPAAVAVEEIGVAIEPSALMDLTASFLNAQFKRSCDIFHRLHDDGAPSWIIRNESEAYELKHDEKWLGQATWTLTAIDAEKTPLIQIAFDYGFRANILSETPLSMEIGQKIRGREIKACEAAQVLLGLTREFLADKPGALDVFENRDGSSFIITKGVLSFDLTLNNMSATLSTDGTPIFELVIELGDPSSVRLLSETPLSRWVFEEIRGINGEGS